MSEEKAERSEAGQKVRWESKTENDGKKEGRIMRYQPASREARYEENK